MGGGGGWGNCISTRSGVGRGSSRIYLVNSSLASVSRWLALDFTTCYRFSPNCTHLKCRCFIYQHSAIAETTVKKHSVAFILLNFQPWDIRLCFHQRYFQRGKLKYQTMSRPEVTVHWLLIEMALTVDRLRNGRLNSVTFVVLTSLTQTNGGAALWFQ